MPFHISKIKHISMNVVNHPGTVKQQKYDIILAIWT